jgi:hypothetical protein
VRKEVEDYGSGMIHASLFNYWKGSLIEKQDRSSKVAQTIPALPYPITPLLSKETA